MREKGVLLVELFFIIAFLSVMFLSLLILFSSSVKKQRENLDHMIAVSIAQSLAVKEKAGFSVKFPIKKKNFVFKQVQFRINGEEVTFIEVSKGGRTWKVPVK